MLFHSRKIVFASYYRVSECCVEARLTVEAQVEIRWRFLGKTVPQRYDVDMWFDMEGDMNGEICQITLHRYRSEASGVKLDEYLVPVFHWEDIEEEAERIIADLVPEGLSDPSRLRPYPFAERLGLKIVSLPLYKRPKTVSILFFGPGDVLTGSSADAPSVSVAVEANTIVLNSHLSGREKDAIFHECFHYIEHRLFFKLQQLHNNDIAAIGRWRPVTLKEGRRSPIEWIEWQANVGSQCLQALLRNGRRADNAIAQLQIVQNIQIGQIQNDDLFGVIGNFYFNSIAFSVPSGDRDSGGILRKRVGKGSETGAGCKADHHRKCKN